MISEQRLPTLALTRHAVHQMHTRRLSPEAVNLVLAYGRVAWTRGARIFAIGRREVERYRCQGLDLAPLEGMQVVTKPDGAIVTVYRNRDLRSLRKNDHPRRRRRSLRSKLGGSTRGLPDWR